MGYYIALEDGQYYEGDTPSFPYKDVPQRAHPTDQLINGIWVAGAVPIPQSVTPYQAIQALNAAGKLDQVEAAINSADKMIQYAWQRATSFDRDSDIVRMLANGFGWSDADLDNLFIGAAAFV